MVMFTVHPAPAEEFSLILRFKLILLERRSCSDKTTMVLASRLAQRVSRIEHA
jgi:hypothetical protein